MRYPSRSRRRAVGARDLEWRASTNACIWRRTARQIVLAASAASDGIGLQRAEAARLHVGLLLVCSGIGTGGDLAVLLELAL